jgi:hypothetical protein
MSGIIEKVRSTVKDTPTYLSIDIDGEAGVRLELSNRAIG